MISEGRSHKHYPTFATFLSPYLVEVMNLFFTALDYLAVFAPHSWNDSKGARLPPRLTAAAPLVMLPAPPLECTS